MIELRLIRGRLVRGYVIKTTLLGSAVVGAVFGAVLTLSTVAGFRAIDAVASKVRKLRNKEGA